MDADRLPPRPRSCVDILHALPVGTTWEEFLATVSEATDDAGVDPPCASTTDATAEALEIDALRRRLGLE